MTAITQENFTDLEKDLIASSLSIWIKDVRGGIHKSTNCFSTWFLPFGLLSCFGVYIMMSIQMLAIAGTTADS